jgi:hypothetical protein
MKTSKQKNESKSSKNHSLTEETLVMHTEGGEMPAVKKSHNREYLNAKDTFSEKNKKTKKS